MELNALLMNRVSKKNDLDYNSVQKGSEQKQNNDTSFDKIFEKSTKANESSKDTAVKNQKPKSKTRTKDFKNQENVEQKVVNPENTKSVEKDAISEKDDSENEMSKSEDVSNPVEQKVLDEGEKSKLLIEANNKVVQELSEILSIPIELLQQIFTDLKIEPVDLINPENLKNFMQVIHEVDNPVDLLNVPNIKKMFEEVKNVIAQHADFVQTIKNVDMSKTLETVEKQPATTTQVLTQNSDTLATKVTNSNFLQQNTQSNQNNEANEEQQISTAKSQNTQDQPISTNAQSKVSTVVTQTVVEEDITLIENNDNPIGLSQKVESNIETVQLKNPVLKPVNTQDVINQIVEKLKVDVRDNVTEVKITLRPDHLGDVTLKISTQNGIVTAQFQADSIRVKEIIESNFNQLKDSLQEQGIQISELSVSVSQDNQQDRMQQFLFGQQKNSHRINKIINGIAAEDLEMPEENNFVNTNDVYDNSVDFEA